MRHAPAYEVRNLTKRYTAPPVLANRAISFTAHCGEAFGVLGPNGAGKSTLVKQLVGLLPPTSGDILLFGEKISQRVSGDRRIGRTVAYLPQGALALGELKVAEVIRWVGMLRGLGKAGATRETDQLLHVLALGGLADRQLRKLSGGQRRLVQVGMTLVAHLPVLILDEPTADIDVELRQTIWDLLAGRAAEGAAVVLVTHDVAEAERVLDRVAIVDAGRVVASGTPAELKARLAHRTRLDIAVPAESPVRLEELAARLGDARVHRRHVSAWVPAATATKVLDGLLTAYGAGAFEDIRLVSPSLEDVYLSHRGLSFAEADQQDPEDPRPAPDARAPAAGDSSDDGAVIAG